MDAYWNKFLHILYEDFGGVFLTGFSVTLLLPLIVAGAFGVVFFRWPTAFGIANLFWRPTGWGRFFAGWGVGALLWQVVLAGYLFEPMATSYTYDRPPYCDVQPPVGTDTDYAPSLAMSADDKVANRWEANPELRYDPAKIGSVLGYLRALTLGTVVGIPVLVLVGVLLLAVFGLVFRLWKLLEAAFDGRSDKPEYKTVRYHLRAFLGEAKLVFAPVAILYWIVAAAFRSRWGGSPHGLGTRIGMAGKWLTLPLGIAVGFVSTAGVSSALWHLKYLTWEGDPYPNVVVSVEGGEAPKAEQSAPDEFDSPTPTPAPKPTARMDGVAYRVGEGVVWLAKYGKADARQEFNERRLGISEKYKTITPERARQGLKVYYETYFDSSTPGGTIVKLRPYYPVFGAFFITFVLSVAGYLVFLLLDVWRPRFTPATGILFILQVALAGHILLSYFVVAPHLFNIALLFLNADGVGRLQASIPRHHFAGEGGATADRPVRPAGAAEGLRPLRSEDAARRHGCGLPARRLGNPEP